MPLTKSDLSQIRGVVSEEVGGAEKRLEQKLGEKLEQKLEEKLEKKLEQKFEQKLKPIKKDIRYIRKTVDLIAKNYDEGDVKLNRRVRKIEQHLAISKGN